MVRIAVQRIPSPDPEENSAPGSAGPGGGANNNGGGGAGGSGVQNYSMNSQPGFQPTSPAQSDPGSNPPASPKYRWNPYHPGSEPSGSPVQQAQQLTGTPSHQATGTSMDGSFGQFSLDPVVPFQSNHSFTGRPLSPKSASSAAQPVGNGSFHTPTRGYRPSGEGNASFGDNSSGALLSNVASMVAAATAGEMSSDNLLPPPQQQQPPQQNFQGANPGIRSPPPPPPQPSVTAGPRSPETAQQGADAAMGAIYQLRQQKKDNALQPIMRRLSDSLREDIYQVLVDSPELVVELCEKERGNVIVQLIELRGPQQSEHLLQKVMDHAEVLAVSQSGCIAFARVFDVASEIQQRTMSDFVLDRFLMLSKHAYGNYAVQRVLKANRPDEMIVVKDKIFENFPEGIVDLSGNKFGSHVLESFLLNSEVPVFKDALRRMLENQTSVAHLCNDRFANYVLQSAMRRAASPACNTPVEGESRQTAEEEKQKEGSEAEQQQQEGTGEGANDGTSTASRSKGATPTSEQPAQLTYKDVLVELIKPQLYGCQYAQNIVKSWSSGEKAKHGGSKPQQHQGGGGQQQPHGSSPQHGHGHGHGGSHQRHHNNPHGGHHNRGGGHVHSQHHQQHQQQQQPQHYQYRQQVTVSPPAQAAGGFPQQTFQSSYGAQPAGRANVQFQATTTPPPAFQAYAATTAAPTDPANPYQPTQVWSPQGPITAVTSQQPQAAVTAWQVQSQPQQASNIFFAQAPTATTTNPTTTTSAGFTAAATQFPQQQQQYQQQPQSHRTHQHQRHGGHQQQQQPQFTATSQTYTVSSSQPVADDQAQRQVVSGTVGGGYFTATQQGWTGEQQGWSGEQQATTQSSHQQQQGQGQYTAAVTTNWTQ